MPADDLFDAAVACALRRRKLKAKTDADPEQSRVTEQTFVLIGQDGQVLDRLPLPMVEREREQLVKRRIKMQDVHLPEIKGKHLQVAAAVVGLYLLIQIAGRWSNMSIRTPVSSAPPVVDTSWIPAGFTKWPGQDVAFRWSKSEYRPGCREDTLCLPVEVIARAGCDSLYVAASMLDAAGRNIGFTNDTTSGIGPGETAVLAMNASEGATQSMRITEISCR